MTSLDRLRAARFDGPQALFTEAVRQIKTARNDGAKEMLDAVCEGILKVAKFAGAYGQPKTEKLLRDMSAEIRAEVAKEMGLE